MVKIGHASSDENKKARGGQAGDQTGNEVCIRDWYNRPWNVMLICTDTALAQRAAAYMKAICEDNDFGYDQGQRTTGYTNIVNAGKDVGKAAAGEFDCSSLVSSCYRLAGLDVPYTLTTRNIRKTFLDTGKFIAYTDSAHLTSDAYATVGAVYLKEDAHVVMALENGSKANSSPTTPTNSSVASVITVNISSNEKAIWDFLKKKGYSDFAVAGIMGNLYAESGLSQINLQNTGNRKLGLTDAEYTVAVDNGGYTNFVRDSQGYGLAQWTYWSRKQNLLNYAKSKKVSIGDLAMQLEFLHKELSESYKKCNSTLLAAKSILEASNAMLFDFERPANQGASVQQKRAKYGQVYYDKYAGKTVTTPTPPTPSPTVSSPYKVGNTYTLQVELNVRTGAGTNYSKKSRSQFTADGRRHDKDNDSALDKGTRVNCLALKTVGQDIWMKIPSGWVAAFYKNQYYIK